MTTGISGSGDILDQFRSPAKPLDEVREKASMNKNEFLLLLTEQLKAQNPLNPSDNKEFAAQLAQFTQLEQTIEMREALQEQVEVNMMLTQSITNLTSANLIGKSVKANTNQLMYDGNNAVRYGFELPSNAEKVTVAISDKTGNIVRTIEVTGKQGQNTFEWDGQRDDGTYVGPGTYSFSVQAEGPGGSALRSSPYSYGRVDSVRFGSNGASVIVGGVAIPVASITDISDSPTTKEDTDSASEAAEDVE